MNHRHRCGYRTAESTLIGGPSENVPGCGFLWEHPRENENNKAKYLEAHICPNCGIGPWFAVVSDPADVLAALTPYPPRAAFGRVLRPAEDNIAYIAREDLMGFAEHAHRMLMRDPFQDAIERFINMLVGDGLVPENGMQVIIFDEENNTISGFNLDGETRQ